MKPNLIQYLIIRTKVFFHAVVSLDLGLRCRHCALEEAGWSGQGHGSFLFFISYLVMLRIGGVEVWRCGGTNCGLYIVDVYV